MGELSHLLQTATFQVLNIWEAKEFEDSSKAYHNDPDRVLGQCHYIGKRKFAMQ